MNLAQALNMHPAARLPFAAPEQPAKPPRSMYRRQPKQPRYKTRPAPVRNALLAVLKDGALTRGEIVRRMSGMDSVAVDVLLCRLVQKGLIVRTKEPGARAFYAVAGEGA